MAKARTCFLAVELLEERRLLSATFTGPGRPSLVTAGDHPALTSSPSAFVPDRYGPGGDNAVSLSRAASGAEVIDDARVSARTDTGLLTGPERGQTVTPLGSDSGLLIPVGGRRFADQSLAYDPRGGFFRQEAFNPRPWVVVEVEVPFVVWEVTDAYVEPTLPPVLRGGLPADPPNSGPIVLYQSPGTDPGLRLQPTSGQADGKELSLKAQGELQLPPLNIQTDRRAVVRIDAAPSAAQAAFEQAHAAVVTQNGLAAALSQPVSLAEANRLRPTDAGVLLRDPGANGSPAVDRPPPDATPYRQVPEASQLRLANPSQPAGGAGAQDWTHLLPQYAELFTNVLPLDARAIESDVKAFFDQLDDLGVAAPGGRGDYLFGPGLLAAAAALAVEMARRQVSRRASAAAARTEPASPSWLPPSDRD